MNVIALIPARYAASRFPGKLMKLLHGVPVISRTYEAAVNAFLFDEVAVVTDSEVIQLEIEARGGRVLMSHQHHECGTDRIAEVATQYSDTDIIINIQGDEPFIQAEPLAALIDLMRQDAGVQVASLMQRIREDAQRTDPNCVKVVTDMQENALLFSRSPIPYHRDRELPAKYYRHVGIYAFRQAALAQFAHWEPGILEQLEKQEGLRFLEHGVPIRMIETHSQSMGIDTPEDLAKAELFIRQNES